MGLVSPAICTIIFEDDGIISTAVQAEEFAAGVLFGSNAIDANFLLELGQDLLRILVDSSQTEDVQSEQETMIFLNAHHRSHKQCFISCLDQIDIFCKMLCV